MGFFIHSSSCASSLHFSWKHNPLSLGRFRMWRYQVSELYQKSLSPSPLSSPSSCQRGFACVLLFLSLTSVCSFSIARLLRILRYVLFSSVQEQLTTGLPYPRHMSLLRSPTVSCRFMTVWTATAVGFSLIPLSPAWRRCFTRSAGIQQSWSWSTSWYVSLLSKGCSGANMRVPGRHLQG